jgi:hypothetical protein
MPFEHASKLELGHRFWMRFRDAEDLTAWCRLIVSELATVVERARSVPAHEVLLGEPLGW